MNDLLAQTLNRKQYFDAMHHRFANQDPLAIKKLLIVLGLLAIAMTLAWILYRLQKRQHEPAKPQPVRLFFRAMRQLRLGLLDRCRIWHVAHRLRIEHPTALLISAPLFDQAVTRYCQIQSSLFLNAPTPTQFNAIRHRLFT